MSSIHTAQPQELSIQWIDLQRARNLIGAKKEEKISLASLIERIVNVYNEADSRQSEFKAVKTTWKPTDNFNVKVYEKVSKVTPVLATVLEQSGAGKREKRVNSEYLLFLYRAKPRQEIVALTSDQAWHAVRDCINFAAPSTVAKYILDPGRIQSFSRCCILSGHVETVAHPNGLEFHTPTAIYYLMESFECQVKGNDKLEEESPLLEIDSLRSSPTVKVSKGLLRIQKRIPLGDYPRILNLFSTYISGKSEENIDPQFEFLQFLQPTTVSKKTLDEALVEKIIKQYLAREGQTIFIQYKHFDDFLRSEGYEIQVKKGGHFKDCKSDRKPTTLENIIWYFEQYFEKPLSEKSLRDCLNQTNLGFTGKRGQKCRASLFDFLSGELRFNGTAYYKLKGMWYELHVDYMAIVSEEFRKLLKKSLLDSDDPFQLPNPWAGSKKQGQVTLSKLNKFIKLEKSEKDKLEQIKGSYIDPEDNEEPIKETRLAGEILKTKKIKDKQKEVEAVLGESSEVDDLEESIAKIDKTFWKALTHHRSVFKKEGQNYYVLTPFTHPFANKFAGGIKEEDFRQFLMEKMKLSSLGSEMEEDYNRSYFYDCMGRDKPWGPDEGYLVFDQITPLGIEPCDILRYTESKTYLYHVKEDLGQSTRDACSQILNAAKIMRSSLSAHQSKNYFHMLWDEGIKTKDAKGKSLKDWRLKISAQLQAIGQKAFLKLFTKRKLVFVYAILQQPKRSLHKEVKLRSRLRPKDIDETQGDEVYKKLQESQYLDSQGRIGTPFLESALTRFELKDLEKKQSGEVYKTISKFKSVTQSSIAKFDLIQLAESLKILGFKLKITEISKKGADKVCSDDFESEESDDDHLQTQTLEKSKADTSGKSFQKKGAIEVQRDSFAPVVGTPNRILNGGNTCYISSALWAVTYSFSEIREFLSNSPKVNDLDNVIINLMQEILSDEEKEISTHVINAFRSQMQLYHPEAFSKNSKGEIKPNEQEDCFDFMLPLIGHAVSLNIFELRRFATLHIFEQIDADTQLDGYDYEKALRPATPPLKDFIVTLNLSNGKENTSIGELISTKQSDNFDRELFPSEGREDLNKEYFKVSHSEEIIIPEGEEISPYFICRLARFEKINGKEKKRLDHVDINDSIEISVKGVNNEGLISDNSDKRTYALQAVIIHSGTGISRGHYYCYLRQASGEWLVCDDVAGIFRCPNHEQVKLDQATNGYIAVYKLNEE